MGGRLREPFVRSVLCRRQAGAADPQQPGGVVLLSGRGGDPAQQPGPVLVLAERTRTGVRIDHPGAHDACPRRSGRFTGEIQQSRTVAVGVGTFREVRGAAASAGRLAGPHGDLTAPGWVTCTVTSRICSPVRRKKCWKTEPPQVATMLITPAPRIVP